MSADHKRAFLAVVISGIILIAWQYFFAPSIVPPPLSNRGAPGVVGENNSGNYENGREGDGASVINPSRNDSVLVTGEAKSGGTWVGGDTNYKNQQIIIKKQVDVEDGEKLVDGNLFEYALNSRLGLSNISNDKLKTSFLKTVGAKEDKIESARILEIQVLENDKFVPIDLEVVDNFKDLDKFTSRNRQLGISFEGEISDDGRLKYKIHSDQPRKFRFFVQSYPGVLEGRNSRQFLFLHKDVERLDVGKDSRSEGMIRWCGVDFAFHLFALIFNETISATYSTSVSGLLTLDTNLPMTEISGSIVYAKKNYDDLNKLGDNLKLSVDFGFFGILAVPILRGLQFFYKFIPNYGVSIIFLTFILRLVTFPLQYKSYKSMKKMQDIKPEMDKIREKFKDDPQKMQRETMELFKRAKTNPFSGCIPLLIQLPIFIAFYQVLFNAVELIEAPFMWWVQDLSIKDPYYVLPLLMTVSMFVQQKMTPMTGMDQTQQKIMTYMMPLIFGFIMKDLPSGLALYIFVSTILGILQQMFVYKTKTV